MPVNKFILRTPLLKLSQIKNNEEEILQAYNTEIINESLFSASKDLHKELTNLPVDKQKREKVILSLYKYFTRMCTRCTPFGYFSGLNIGEFSEETDIVIADSITAKLRLDMDYLCNLYYELSKDKTLYPFLTFYKNNTLYRTYDQWRYVEYKFKDTIRFHNLISVDDNEVLSAILLESNKGITYEQIIKIIIDFDYSRIEAEEYIDEIIKNQILVSNLYPTVTGKEYQKQLFGELKKTGLEQFKNLEQDLFSILNSRKGIAEMTRQIERFLLGFNIPINTNHLIQIDLLKKVKNCNLNNKIRDKISAATELLALLMPKDTSGDILEKFKMAFYERYENSFVPLSLVMDTDVGLGYKNSVSSYWESYKSQDSNSGKLAKEVKLKLLLRAISTNSINVDLEEKDLVELKKTVKPKPLPASYSFIGNIYQHQSGATKILYKSAGGPSAINLIGRFGHLDTQIYELCKELALEEESYYSNVILAEIVHLPQGRIGNILTRPHYRDYEIVYLSHSSLPTDQQISVDDLYVGIVNFRLVLFSKNLNKEIIPRLSNAHNFHYDSLPIYHFLCNLQSANLTSNIYWMWDDLNYQEFLPRVTYKDVILTPAKWNIKTSELRKYFKVNNNDDFRTCLPNNFPSIFLIIQGDNDLYIDLSSSIGIKTFKNFCNKYEMLVIEEFLYDSSNTVDGYTSEIVIPFSNPNNVKYEGIGSINLSEPSIRNHSPFSKWIYIKLYSGKSIANRILIEVIPNLIKKLKHNKIITKWFFIRFTDPKSHLRLRFELVSLDERNQLFETLTDFTNEYLYNGLISDIQIGTYQREIERYGHQTIADCENWFCLNSEMTLDILPLLKQTDYNNAIIYVLGCVENILNQFQLTLLEKMSFLNSQSSLFNKEFNVSENKPFRIKLNEDYRAHFLYIESVINKIKIEENDVYSSIDELVTLNEKKSIPVISDILSKCQDLPKRKLEILSSFIHMFINRVFENNQRNKEMVVYYFLSKYYASVGAKLNLSDKSKFKIAG